MTLAVCVVWRGRQQREGGEESEEEGERGRDMRGNKPGPVTYCFLDSGLDSFSNSDCILSNILDNT